MRVLVGVSGVKLVIAVGAPHVLVHALIELGVTHVTQLVAE